MRFTRNRTLSFTLSLLIGAALGSRALATDYYADPVMGSMANPGTAASPWSTLAAVFAAGKTFQAGDTIYLLRGYHGSVTVTGSNMNDVFIVAGPGHTPVFSLALLNADHWYFKGLTILGKVVIDNQSNENSHNDTFDHCYLPGPAGGGGGFEVYGTGHTLQGNHVQNGGIHLGYHANYAVVSGNVIEDFYSDAMDQKGNYGLFETNLVMNAHKVNGNHNDMFQGWATTGNVLRGNEFRAYTDPGQADLLAYGLSDVQGIGLFDGWYTDWVIENNVLFIDHPIGIWILGGKGCQVRNNTVARCYGIWEASRPPNISVAAKKSANPPNPGAPSINCIVENNAAERFELDWTTNNSGVSFGISTCNIVVAKSAFFSTYLNWGNKDLHLKAGAPGVINTGTSSNSPPVVDADSNPRPFGGAWDCGAFEYGYVTAADTTPPSQPTGLSAVIIAGYGVDLHWAASTDNRSSFGAGYNIYRNGVYAGRTRAGTNYLDINSDTTGFYNVQAFDHSGNVSAMSDPVGGTPPVQDTEAPSVPTNVLATALSSSAIKVTWSAATDNVAVTAYQIYRDGTGLPTVSGLAYTDTGLAASSPHSYTVSAVDWAGNVSAQSATAVATTLPPDLTPPSVPTNVTASATSSSTILLTWTASTDDRGVLGYNIYSSGDLVDTVTTTNSLETGLDASTVYSFTVTAFDAAGNESAPSAPPAIATTFAPPPLLVGESFEYTAGVSLNGLNGGTGWSGPWIVGYNSNYPATIQTGNLGSYPGLGCSGNSLQFWTAGNGSTYENLDRSFATIINDEGQTLWFAMMVGMCNAKNLVTWHLAGLTTDVTGTNDANLFETTANGTPTPFKFGSTTLFTGDTNWTPHLVLVRIQMSGDTNAESLTAYCDPDLSANPNAWTGVVRSNLYANGGIVGFYYRGGRASTGTPNVQFQMDEIRMASTWQDAVALSLQDTQAPATPTNLTATAISPSAIALAWSTSTDNVGVAGYYVYRGGSNIANVSATSYLDQGLAASTLYSYTVMAFDAATNVSSASAAASATTFAAPDTEAPSAPTNVTASALSSSAILVTWSASTDNVGVAGYYLYRDGSNIATVSATSYTDTGLVASTLYSYTVAAFDGATNLSPASAAASATTLAPPTGGTVLAEEQFTNAPGPLVGLTGGAGWSGGWIVDSHYDTEAAGHYEIIADVLTNYPGQTVSGGYGSFLSGGGGTYYPSAQRNLATPLTDDGGTYWLAFQLQAPSYHKFSSITLLGTTNVFVYLKDSVTGMNFQFLGGAYYSPGDTGAHLFLIKIQMSGDAGAESAALYYDPDLSASPSSWTALRTGVFTLTSGSLTAFRADSARAGSASYRVFVGDIRLATTWQAAVGQTEAAATAPQITGVYLGGPTSLVLQWQSVPGKTYKIQAATNLLTGFYDTSDTNIVATNSITSRTVTVGPAPAGFYRVGVLP